MVATRRDVRDDPREVVRLGGNARMTDTMRARLQPPAATAVSQPEEPAAPTAERPGLLDQIRIAAETDGYPAAEELIARHEAHLWSGLSKVAEPNDLKTALFYADRAFDRAPASSRAGYARRV